MSGILALVRLDGGPADAERLGRMAREMAYRGPDGAASRVVGAAGLAHALLRAARQAEREAGPRTLEGAAWIVADARLDGREELIRSLRAAGRVVAPEAPDADLVLHAYAAWETACTDRLLGDFAFALWDAPRRRLFCARDPFGVKPLLLARAAGEVAVSNTLAPLLAHPAVSAEPDEEAIAEFLAFGHPRDLSLSFHRGVRSLPPAHTLVVEDGEARVRRFWTLPADGELRLPRVRDYAEAFGEVFARAVADRLRWPEAAVQMSGGRDSTAVAATAVRVAPGVRLKAFTAVFDRAMADGERRWAGLAASALGVPVDFLPVDGYLPFERWDEVAARHPGPVDDPLLATEADQLARMAAHARVALTGHGGDAALRESPSRLARLLAGGHVLRALGEAAAYARLHRRLPRPGVRTWLRERAGEAPWRPPLPTWIRPGLAARTGLRERWEAAFAPRPPGHPLRPEAHAQLSDPLLPRFLERLDPGATGLSLEVRHPFLDVRFVSFVLSVPPAAWYNDKGLLIASMRGTLPGPLLRRPKTPLPGDPVALALAAAGGVAGAPGPEADPFVDRRLLPRWTGGEADGDPADAWLHLRALALSRWLRGRG